MFEDLFVTSEETSLLPWVWLQVDLEVLSKPFEQSHLASSQPSHSHQLEVIPLIPWL